MNFLSSEKVIGFVVLAAWTVINMYFTLKNHEKSINGIGVKTRTIDAKIFNDRLIDVACTKELDLRLWKADQFKEEVKR